MSLGTEVAYDVLQTVVAVARPMLLRKLSRTTGPNPVVTHTDTTVLAAVQNYSLRAIDGTMIVAGDRKVSMLPHASGVVPEEADKFVVGFEEFPVVSVRPMEMNGVVALYSCQTRK